MLFSNGLQMLGKHLQMCLRFLLFLYPKNKEGVTNATLFDRCKTIFNENGNYDEAARLCRWLL